MSKSQSRLSKKEWAWVFTDWANSAFATTVMAGFFPVFLKEFWLEDPSQSTFYLGVVSSLVAVLVLFTAPALGALADAKNERRFYLCLFTLIGGASTMWLGWTDQGHWPQALCLYLLGTYCFSSSLGFYDSLLFEVTTKDRFDWLSSLGYAFGYLGGGLLFLLQVFAVTNPKSFGLENAAIAIQWSFISTGIWWALFTLPLLMTKKDKDQKAASQTASIQAYQKVWQSLRKLKGNKPLLFFLLAYVFYIDGVNTVIKMAVDYGLTIGISSNDLIKALLMVQFIGFPSAILFGKASQKWGSLRGLRVAILGYIAICLAGSMISQANHFFALAAGIGLIQGGLQAMSRSYFGSLVPSGEASEYFSIYNTLSKASALLGPLMVAVFSLIHPRLGILSLTILFVLGLFFLKQMEKKSHPEATFN